MADHTLTIPHDVLWDYPGNQLKWLKATLRRINLANGRCCICGRAREPERLRVTKCKACSDRNTVYLREKNRARRAAEKKAEERRAKKLAPPEAPKVVHGDPLDDLLG